MIVEIYFLTYLTNPLLSTFPSPHSHPLPLLSTRLYVEKLARLVAAVAVVAAVRVTKVKVSTVHMMRRTGERSRMTRIMKIEILMIRRRRPNARTVTWMV